MIRILTGDVGVGKTTVCLKIIEQLRSRGIKVGGILTPALLNEQGEKIGIQILNLESDEIRTLARKDVDLGGPRIGQYFFDEEALTWGVEIVLGALRFHRNPTFIDEIGPLELLQGQGFAPILEDLPETPKEINILMVVRRALLETLQERLSGQRTMVLEVNEANRNLIPMEIVSDLLHDEEAGHHT